MFVALDEEHMTEENQRNDDFDFRYIAECIVNILESFITGKCVP